MSYATVGNVWRHYQTSGSLTPSYARCARSGIRKKAEIYEEAIALKSQHPGWGAGLIWVELAETFAETDLPSLRTLQRWFHRGGVAQERLRDQAPQPQVIRGEKAHEVWAMDAKEDMTLQDGSTASWLVISDEGSGALLQDDLFPRETLEQSGAATGQSRDPGRT